VLNPCEFVSTSSRNSAVVITSENLVFANNGGDIWAAVDTHYYIPKSVAAYDDGYYAITLNPPILQKYVRHTYPISSVTDVLPENVIKNALAMVASETDEILFLVHDPESGINRIMTSILGTGSGRYELNQYDEFMKENLIGMGDSVRQIAISQSSPASFAVVTDRGSVFTWGWNTGSNLGYTIERRGPTLRINNVNEPKQVPGIYDAVAIGISESHLVAVREDGSLWSPNPYWNGALSGITDARAVHCAEQVTMILHDNERVSICGFLRLTDPSTGNEMVADTPIDVEVLPKMTEDEF
jgi:hypothetical protein